MKFLYVVIAIILIAFVVISAIDSKERNSERGVDKYRAKPLLTENEKGWYRAIKEAVPHAHVFGQVAMNQLVGGTGDNGFAAHGKIKTRSIDFVVLKPELDVLIAIEIDDRSHNTPKRRADDEKKSHALKEAGIALLRIPATPALPSEEIKRRIVETVATHARSRMQA